MRKLVRSFTPFIFSAALAASLFTTGCTVHACYGYRGDYHTWNDHETVYYNQWEVETHRPHAEFTVRTDSDKKAYWKWRDKHHD